MGCSTFTIVMGSYTFSDRAAFILLASFHNVLFAFAVWITVVEFAFSFFARYR